MKARIRIAPDGTLTGKAAGLPTGEHEAEITLLDQPRGGRLDEAALLLAVRKIQREVARMPVLDNHGPDEIVGYNQRGHFD